MWYVEPLYKHIQTYHGCESREPWTIGILVGNLATVLFFNQHYFANSIRYTKTGNFNKNWQGVTYPVNTTVYPSDVSLTKHWI